MIPPFSEKQTGSSENMTILVNFFVSAVFDDAFEQYK